MDTYADDLAELVSTIDLECAVLVGHSTGGGEVARARAQRPWKACATTRQDELNPDLLAFIEG